MGRTYLDCPHCEGRHISLKNIEFCRKLHSNYQYLTDWASNQEPEGVFYTEVSYLMWATIILSVRQRNNNTCQECGITSQSLYVKFEVHHITPRSKGGNDHPSNLKFLCLKCHHYAHSKRGKVIKENYRLTSFTPQFFNTKGVQVTYLEFLKEREFLMQPYLNRNKKKRGKRAKKI